MQALVSNQPTFTEDIFVIENEADGDTLAMLKDPVCGRIINPSNEDIPPVQCSECHKIYCFECQQDILEAEGDEINCPYCHKMFIPIKPDDLLVQILESLTTRCKNYFNSCTFTSKLADLPTHEGTCDVNQSFSDKENHHDVAFIEGDSQSEEFKEDSVALQDDFSSITCENGHSLERVIDLATLDKGYINNYFKCGNCRKMRKNKDGVLCCLQCNFNLCTDCEETDHIKCVNNHRLKRVLQLKLEKPIYSDNNFVCDICSKQDQSSGLGVLHCSICDYDICHSCEAKKSSKK